MQIAFLSALSMVTYCLPLPHTAARTCNFQKPCAEHEKMPGEIGAVHMDAPLRQCLRCVGAVSNRATIGLGSSMLGYENRTTAGLNSRLLDVKG